QTVHYRNVVVLVQAPLITYDSAHGHWLRGGGVKIDLAGDGGSCTWVHNRGTITTQRPSNTTTHGTPQAHKPHHPLFLNKKELLQQLHGIIKLTSSHNLIEFKIL